MPSPHPRIAHVASWLVASWLATACSLPPSFVPRDGGADTVADAAAPGLDPTDDGGIPMRVEVEAAGSLQVGRVAQTATLLPNGHVLVIGGETLASRAPLRDIDEYDPATNRWTRVAMLPTPRANHTATLLIDGRILIVGGGRDTWNDRPSGDAVLDSAVLYDPATREIAAAASLTDARGHHDAVRLDDGSVLVVGGARGGELGFAPVATAERYLPEADAWVPAGTLATPRAMLRVVLDGQGDPLVLGGLRAPGTTLAVVSAVERWRDGAFTPAGSLPGGGRVYHATIRSDDGDVWIAGGLSTGIFLTAFERLAAGGDSFTSMAALPGPRNAIALAETGRGMLLIGGFEHSSTGAIHQDVLLYDHDRGRFEVVGMLPSGRSGHSAVTLPDGDVLVVGGQSPDGVETGALRLHLRDR